MAQVASVSFKEATKAPANNKGNEIEGGVVGGVVEEVSVTVSSTEPVTNN